MSSFSFVQTAPEAGDCTAPYDILFHKKMTVKEFIKEVLTRHEWGFVNIYDPDAHDNLYKRKDCVCCYLYDEVKSCFPVDILNTYISSASAHGGWTRMDYMLKLEE